MDRSKKALNESIVMIEATNTIMTLINMNINIKILKSPTMFCWYFL
jgi:hypothetical protein